MKNKDYVLNNKKSIELIQSSIISGVASLFYSEYISKFNYRAFPVRSVMIPPIKDLNNYLNINSDFMKYLSNKLVNDISKHYLIKDYINTEELKLFNNDNIEILKEIFNEYIALNISLRIPKSFIKKFGLDNQNQQMFRETWDINIFDQKPIMSYHYKYILEEIVLNLIMSIESIEKEELPIDDNKNIVIRGENEILTISHSNAICPIHFNSNIFDNEFMDTLRFVTSTSVSYVTDTLYKEGIKIDYMIDTNSNNEIKLSKIIKK